MSAVLHWVADDFNVGAGRYPSRVGGYNGSGSGVSTSTLDGPAADPLHAAFRRGVDITSPGLSVTQKADFPLCAAPGKACSYEWISWGYFGETTTIGLIGSGGAGSQEQLLQLIDSAGNKSFKATLNNGSNDAFQLSNFGATDGSPYTAVHHYVWSADFSGSNLVWSFYYDGTLVGSHTSISGAWALPGDATALLKISTSGGPVHLIELMVHDQALTAAQVKQRSFNYRSLL